MKRAVCFLLCLLASLSGVHAENAAWKHGLFGSNNDLWRKRIAVTVVNTAADKMEGLPVACLVGSGPEELDLVNASINGIRVCDSAGTELLSEIVSPQGATLHSGRVPAGAKFYFPVTLPAGGQGNYFIYFENPSAFPSSEFLKLPTQPAPFALENPDLESGMTGWSEKRSTDTPAEIQLSLSADQPHSGKNALYVKVPEGSTKSWCGFHQSVNTAVVGAKVSLRAFVRARNVQGQAGLYVHGLSSDGKLIYNRVVNAGAGTYHWKEITHTFSIPEGVAAVDVGTVLYGTGEAWYDTFSLTTDVAPATPPAPPVTLRFSETQTLPVMQDAVAPAWPGRFAGNMDAIAIPLTIYNDSDSPADNTLAAFEMGRYALRGMNIDDLEIYDGKTKVNHVSIAGNLFFECHVPAHSTAMYYLYYVPRYPAKARTLPEIERALPVQSARTDESVLGSGILSDQVYVERSSSTMTQQLAKLIESKSNLIRNPSFEDAASDVWSSGAEGKLPAGAEFRRVTESPFHGKACAYMNIPPGSAPAWTGWRQTVPVEPNQTYLIAAWARTRDLNGSLMGHLHFLKSNGKVAGMCSFGSPLTGNSPWSLLSTMQAMPNNATQLTLHLTMSATGEVWHDAALIARITPSRVGKPVLRSKQDSFAIWPVNPIIKVFEDSVPPPQPEPLHVSLAGNEQEPLQIAIRSERDMGPLTLEVKVPDGIQAPSVKVVGLVPVAFKSAYTHSGAKDWERKRVATAGNTDGWPDWWPDPLLPESTLTVESGKTRAFWITFHAPADAKAGTYTCELLLKSAGKVIKQLPVTLKVRSFALPKENHIQVIYDLRLTKQWFTPQKNQDKVSREVAQLMADNRVTPDSVIGSPSFKLQDGKVIADFTQYDSSADWHFNKAGFQTSYTPQLFYCFGWSMPPAKFLGIEPYIGKYPYKDVDRSELNPEYKRVYQECLRLFWNHMKEKGWADKFVLYISDEPFYDRPEIAAQMKALCTMVHEVDKNIRIYSSTWGYCPEWAGYLDIWGVAHYGKFPVAKIAELRARGSSIWYTTDGQMCLDTPYCGFERMMPYYCFKYDVRAYEFWGIGWLTNNPYQYGWHNFTRQSDTPNEYYYIQYPNGDGYLLYPGNLAGYDAPVTSVRFEETRDGSEDYEYLYMLKSLVNAGKQAGKDVAHAEHLLNVVNRLVQIPNAGGRFSTKFLPNPDLVPALRELIGDEIEKLK